MASKQGSTRKKLRRLPIQFIRFPEVKGKIVESVEADPDAISIHFRDKTALTFEVDSCHILYPELADWKTGNMRSIKQWPSIHSKPAMLRWP